MSFEFITFTPEQATRWKKIVLSDPERAVRCLRVDYNHPRSSDGDEAQEITAALAAVSDMAAGYRNNGGVQTQPEGVWASLVKAGVVDALCKNVEEMTCLEIRMLPSMPKKMQEQARRSTPSPYYAPLEALCKAVVNFSVPPTELEMHIIAELKPRWSAMMERLFTEPENALVQDDGHVRERLVVGKMLDHILTADPSFIKIICDPNDNTIPVLVLYWMHSTSFYDHLSCLNMLGEILAPEHPGLRAARAEFDTKALIARVLYGASAGDLTSKSAAKLLATTFAANLARHNGLNAQMELSFFQMLFRLCYGWHAEFHEAALNYTPLWGHMFGLLRRVVEKQTADRTANREGYILVQNILVSCANAIHLAQYDTSQGCGVLIEDWAEVGFFDILDQTMPTLLEQTNADMQICRIMACVCQSRPEFSSATVRVLRKQLPRQRTLRALLFHSTGGVEDPSLLTVIGTTNLAANDKPNPDNPMWKKGCWEGLACLTYEISIPQECGRRGCEAKSGAKCAACMTMAYCGQACQKRDWKEHKLVCKWTSRLNSLNNSWSSSVEATPNTSG